MSKGKKEKGQMYNIQQLLTLHFLVHWLYICYFQLFSFLFAIGVGIRYLNSKGKKGWVLMVSWSQYQRDEIGLRKRFGSKYEREKEKWKRNPYMEVINWEIGLDKQGQNNKNEKEAIQSVPLERIVKEIHIPLYLEAYISTWLGSAKTLDP